MTPKEKAEELVDKFDKYSYENGLMSDKEKLNVTKSCALIAVEEILRLDEYLSCFYGEEFWYWQEVKQEIDKL